MREILRAVALGNKPADLLIKNCQIVDVITESIYTGDVAVAEGYIAAVGKSGSFTDAKQILDIKGAYLAPGLINAHCHVESSMAAPNVYCAEELRWGVTTLITDPHEIANVAGAEGIKYMLKSGRKMPINYFVELPSCVPATPFEHAGSILDAKSCADLMHIPGILGLGEMMNVPGVLESDNEVIKKITMFLDEKRVIDGHAPMVTGKHLQAYAASGIKTDHESISWEEAKEKLRAGLAVLIREGSASRNLTAIVKGLLNDNADVSNLAFCTDDKHLADIRKEGTILHCVKMAIALGMNPIRALRIASINAARIYGLNNLGAIAPGWQADLVVFDNLENLQPIAVFHQGKNIADFSETISQDIPLNLKSSVHPATFSEKDFAVDNFLAEKIYPVIKMLPGEIFTEKLTLKGSEIPKALATGKVHLIAVLERHHGTGNLGLGLLQGYGLKNGAAATTVAHDSHNLIVIGTNVQDMVLAIQELLRVQGGYTLVHKGNVVGTMPLDICGLMSSLSADEIISGLETIKQSAHAQGVAKEIDPFISLSFMALPVIPKIRITDMGMFDVDQFTFYK